MATIAKTIDNVNTVTVSTCPDPCDCLGDVSMATPHTHFGTLRVQNLTGDTYEIQEYFPVFSVIASIPPGVTNVNTSGFSVFGSQLIELVNTNGVKDADLSYKTCFFESYCSNTGGIPNCGNYSSLGSISNVEVWHLLDVKPIIGVEMSGELKICDYLQIPPACPHGIPNGGFRIDNETTPQITFTGGQMINQNLRRGNSTRIFTGLTGNTTYWQTASPINVQVSQYQNGNFIQTLTLSISSFTEPSSENYGYCFKIIP